MTPLWNPVYQLTNEASLIKVQKPTQDYQNNIKLLEKALIIV